MYFTDRVQAGKLLAEKLKQHGGKKNTIVALSDGAVVVAAQVADVLKCPMTLLLAAPIKAPGEPDPVASISQSGSYSFNSKYSDGEQDEFDMEYHQVFEQQKIDRLNEMHRLLGKNEVIRKDLIRGHTIILVADGLGDTVTIDAAALFLKSIHIEKLIIATPFAGRGVVDRMHILGDEIVCLNVVSNFMGVDHYYDHNKLPDHQTIVATIQNLLQNWQH